MKLKTLATVLLGGMLSFSTIAAEMTKTEVEKIVREYLVSNPEILIEMSNGLRAKQEMQQDETDKALLKKNMLISFSGKKMIRQQAMLKAL